MTELIIERLLDAPPDVVWKAFTDPDELAQWFGPIGFSVPRESVSVDARPGGHQRLVMVNDDDPSQTSPVDAVFDEVIENQLLVGREEFNEEMAALFGTSRMTMRLEFHDAGDGKTLIKITQGPYSEDFEPMARAGWNSSFTKLDGMFLRRLGLLPT
jgi:uncharacterized protein YndB with AHSA1/START domain